MKRSTLFKALYVLLHITAGVWITWFNFTRVTTKPELGYNVEIGLKAVDKKSPYYDEILAAVRSPSNGIIGVEIFIKYPTMEDLRQPHLWLNTGWTNIHGHDMSAWASIVVQHHMATGKELL